MLLTFSPSTSREPFVNDGLGKDCMVLLTCGPKPDTSLVSRRGSGFSYGLFGRCAPMAMAVSVRFARRFRIRHLWSFRRRRSERMVTSQAGQFMPYIDKMDTEDAYQNFYFAISLFRAKILLGKSWQQTPTALGKIFAPESASGGQRRRRLRPCRWASSFSGR